MTNIMPEAAGGADTMYPEYRKKLKDRMWHPRSASDFAVADSALPTGFHRVELQSVRICSVAGTKQ